MTGTKRLSLALLAVGILGIAVGAEFFPETPPPPPVVNAVTPETAILPQTLDFHRGDTFEDLLVRAGVERSTKLRMIEALRGTFDVRKFRAGSELTVNRSVAGTLESVEYRIDPDHKLRVSITDGNYRAAVVDVPGVLRTVSVCGVLEGSLYESLARTGESPELAVQMAGIFAWDLDFYTDPRAGDEFCLLIEKKEYRNGQPPTYRRILSASYRNSGELYEGFLFPDKDGRAQYYARDGKSLQSAFLRSPLKFEARISSHFSWNRYHPILKIRRPHLGTDYAAPTGTPVQSIASGRVTFSGRSGGSGNLIKIRHANGFETMYMHLSRRYVRRGQRVSQGQRIGVVGATGLATGPHLDFRLRKNGKYLNFEHLRPPRSSKIPAQQMAAYTTERDHYAALMYRGARPDGAVLAKSDSPKAPPAVD